MVSDFSYQQYDSNHCGNFVCATQARLLSLGDHCLIARYSDISSTVQKLFVYKSSEITVSLALCLLHVLVQTLLGWVSLYVADLLSDGIMHLASYSGQSISISYVGIT